MRTGALERAEALHDEGMRQAAARLWLRDQQEWTTGVMAIITRDHEPESEPDIMEIVRDIVKGG